MTQLSLSAYGTQSSLMEIKLDEIRQRGNSSSIQVLQLSSMIVNNLYSTEIFVFAEKIVCYWNSFVSSEIVLKLKVH